MKHTPRKMEIVPILLMIIAVGAIAIIVVDSSISPLVVGRSAILPPPTVATIVPGISVTPTPPLAIPSVTIPLPVPSTIPLVSSPIIWTMDADQSTWTPVYAGVGNRAQKVFMSRTNNSWVRLASTVAPANPNNPVIDWTYSSSEDVFGTFPQYSASKGSAVYAMFSLVKVLPTNTFRTPILRKFSNNGLDWEYVFSSVSITGGNTRMLDLEVMDDGKIIVLITRSSGTAVFAVFNPSSNVPIVYNANLPIGVLYSFDVSRDGTTVVASDTYNSLYFIDVASGQIINSIISNGSIYCAGISGNGEWAAYGKFDEIKLYRKQGGQFALARTYSNLGTMTTCVGTPFKGSRTLVLSDDGKTLVAGLLVTDSTFSIHVYNNFTGTKKWEYVVTGQGANQNTISDISMSLDGTRFAVGNSGTTPSSNPTILAFLTSTGEPIFTHTTSGSVFDIDMSNDGALVSWANKKEHANIYSSDGAWGLLSLSEVTPLPETPRIKLLTAVSPLEITLKWEKAKYADGYKIFVSTMPQACPAGVNPIVVDDETEKYSITGLSPNTRHYVSMLAYNVKGSSFCTKIQNAQTQNWTPPTAPSNFSVASSSPGVLRLSWTNTGNYQGIRVWRSTQPNVPTTGTPYATLSQGTITTYDDTQAQGGTRYYYRIAGYDAYGNGPPSSEASGIPSAVNCGPGTYNSSLFRCVLTANVQADDTVYKFTLAGQTWNDIWTATVGTRDTIVTTARSFQSGARIEIPYLTFDTATLPDNATLYETAFQYSVEAKEQDFGVELDKVYLLRANHSATIIGDDYEQCGYPMTNTGQPILADTIDISNTPLGANSIPLNASGLNHINKTGATKVCLQTHQAYTGVRADYPTYLKITAKESTANPSGAPKLVIYYLS